MKHESDDTVEAAARTAADRDVSTTAARDAARLIWFKRYPAKQTAIAFLLALIATAAFSIDPSAVSNNSVLAIDPHASGTLYICYEVLLSFAGHTDAVMLLALACLLTLPFRYVFFGRGDAWRPSVIIPSVFFAVCMVFGRSYDLTDSAELVLGDKARTICAWIGGAGWTLLAVVGFYLAFECLDWLCERRIPFSESRFGRLWRACHTVLSRRPFLGPFLLLALLWLPAYISAMPGLFMGDTGAQIRQWFNYPNGTSDYLKLVNPNVLLNGHHPVVHTALIGSCVKLGLTLFNSADAGVLIYTTLQYVITAASAAYSISSMRKFGVSLPVRALGLGFFALVPLFSNYSVLLTKDVLFADALLVMLVQTVKLLAAGLSRRGEDAERAGERVPVLFAPHDWALFVLSALGTTFLRNGGLVFPAAACVIAAGFAAWDAHRERHAAAAARSPRAVSSPAAPASAMSAAAVPCMRPGSRVPRLRWVGILAVLALCLASNMYFTKVFMPAHDITPGSKREMLSIPFQQTARFVQKHDGLNSGVQPVVKDDGTVEEPTSDGLVTQHEREVIDRVLVYGNLGRRYNPDKSDAVKNCFNEDASDADIKEYFKVWAEMFHKDPESYISALINNYYGYFYPSERDAWFYSTAFSAEVMARPDNTKYFDFHPVDSEAVRFCDHVVNLYRVAVQRVPLVSLTMSSATYVWIMVAIVVYLLRRLDWRALAIWVPLMGVLAVCLIGPCNGSTYMRYLYPVILCMPFTIGVTVTRNDIAWRRR